MGMLNEVCHLWFSKTDWSKGRKGAIWKLIATGEEVEITNACEDKGRGERYNSADAVYLGQGTFSHLSEWGLKRLKELMLPADATSEQVERRCLESLKELQADERECALTKIELN